MKKKQLAKAIIEKFKKCNSSEPKPKLMKAFIKEILHYHENLKYKGVRRSTKSYHKVPCFWHMIEPEQVYGHLQQTNVKLVHHDPNLHWQILGKPCQRKRNGLVSLKDKKKKEIDSNSNGDLKLTSQLDMNLQLKEYL